MVFLICEVCVACSMAERALEVEARLKEAAATVVGLKDKVCCLEKDYKAAKSQAGSKSNSPPPSTSTTTNVVDNHDIIKERLEVAEAQLAHDSDLVSKLYHRVCVLNSSLVEAKNKGVQQQQGSSARAITATSPRRLYVKLHRHPKAGSSCDGSAKTSPRDGDPKDGDNVASTSAGSSAVTSPRSDQLANASAELPRPLNDHEVDWILHVCGKNFEDVGIKLSDANEKLISQLRDRVRVLTDEAKKDRTPSPGRRSPEGTTTPPRSGVMSPAAAVSPFQPSPGVINIGEAPSVTVQKMEDSLTQVQNRCKALAAEIDYMEKKKAAAVDAIKTLDAAISEKLPLLKSATLDAKRLRRCLKRSEEEEEPIKETRLANLIKLFKKPDKNIEKYLINRRGNKFDV
ncbi:uncharacterized protein LOC112343585 isoform X3 [Selaginella moellendorffii]|uniref:uncharacterized protein LOC112343585 isoform X3 n=1 Tax=Selaginella moellendorffii TaxID=88036 RepID=UPI000D1C2661|nr:uncharacterized protein LOC112343585 isoform X3 [Selaginella moellendorffii]|eukprot:XP_024523077.1 uncharacterized protein LOC112343585 isoform X3 [Selaginella moellendorffii]